MTPIFLNRRLRYSRSLLRTLFVGSVLLGTFLGNGLALGSVQVTLPSPQISHKMAQLQKSQKRWIQINLTTQQLTAWEGEYPVFTVTVSTGKPSTPTPLGVFAIQSKHLIERMRGRDYDVPNVPYTMYFYRGYAIHGTYLHNQFGTAVSHGCTNVSMVYAKWLFEWAPNGTSVVIHR
jgi:lipoprotein-anchoring transpeptidase ErfK/SrfK